MSWAIKTTADDTGEKPSKSCCDSYTQLAKNVIHLESPLLSLGPFEAGLSSGKDSALPMALNLGKVL